MDRKSIIDRHHPVINRIEPNSPLSIGNGEFGFSADITGLQTFPEAYNCPLGTQSNWGWHYTGGKQVYTEQDIRYQLYDTYGRQVPYPMRPEDREEAYNWLRQNPHRVQLGRIGFRFIGSDGRWLEIEQISGIDQKLDLWTGMIHSRFLADGVPVDVHTVCHGERDAIGVFVESPLIGEGRLQIVCAFPCPDMTHTSWAKSVDLNWQDEERHLSEIATRSEQHAVIRRTMDEDGYEMCWGWNDGELVQTGRHEFTLHSRAGQDRFVCTFHFAPEGASLIDYEQAAASSASKWQTFWESGGAADFADSTDERAMELERRVVLSQYLTAIHSAGSMPPQETGYMYNSWFGKFHLEMHWWHAAHFPLWGRASMLERSMGWYLDILPLAYDLARSQGYEGARWPKMVGYDGKQSPSKVAPGLIWQQPHPIALAELLYLAEPSKQVLERYAPIVFASADFMVSYAHWNPERRSYDLGPPLIPAQECHPLATSMNPPYELEYWRYGLEIAVLWAERLGKQAKAKWREAAAAMAPLPQLGGVYLAHERCPETFTVKNHDHPSMVGALGILPGKLVDREVMRRTLLKVKEEWRWDTAWGWDFPMCAMTATRLGERELAVDFLLMDAVKNTYLPSGHNYQRPGLYAYLPGNGGLLAAVAMMLCGYQGGEANCPGFPQDGRWTVRWEGLKPLL
jgi:hypothetical protein